MVVYSFVGIKCRTVQNDLLLLYIYKAVGSETMLTSSQQSVHSFICMLVKRHVSMQKEICNLLSAVVIRCTISLVCKLNWYDMDALLAT